MSGYNLANNYQAVGLQEDNDEIGMYEEDGEVDFETLNQQLQKAEEKNTNNINEAPQKKENKSGINIRKEHPLKTLENQERHFANLQESQGDNENKFVLSNSKRSSEFKHTGIEYFDLSVITNFIFKDEAIITDGVPRVVCILPEKKIAIGTTLGTIFLFDYSLTSVERLGSTTDFSIYGGITSMDMCARDELIICGYEQGHIILWSGLKKTDHIHMIPPAAGDDGPILGVRIWRENPLEIITTNSSGGVYLFSFKTQQNKLKIDKKILIDQIKKRSDLEPTNEFARLPSGYYQIQLLEKIYAGDSMANSTIIALVCPRAILLASLETPSLFCRIDRPSKLSDVINPYAAWGRGVTQDLPYNKYPLLAVSWGVDVFIYKVEAPRAEGVIKIGYYRAEKNVTHIHFGAENLLVLLLDGKDFLSLNTASIPGGFVENIPNFDFSRAVINIQSQLKQDIMPHFYGKNNYFSSIHSSSRLRRTFIVKRSSVVVIKAHNWRNFFHDLCEKAEWISAFTFLISLFNGSQITFPNFPLNERERRAALNEIIKETIFLYISSMIKAMEVENIDRGPIQKTMILTITDLLVSTEEFEYLFKEAKDYFSSNNLLEVFWDELKYFILRGRIKSISYESFRELIKHYVKTNETNIIQCLIINLSPDTINVDQTIDLCTEYHLLSGLMYLYTHDDDKENFIIPISIALKTYQSKIAEMKRKDSVANSKLTESAETYGLKLLWFLNITLKQERFKEGRISDSVWAEQIFSLVVFVFEPNHLRDIIAINPFVAFECLRLFFREKVISIFESTGKTIYPNITEETRTSFLQKYADASEVLFNGLEIFSKTFKDGIVGQMFAVLHYIASGDKISENLLYYNMAEICYEEDFSLPLEFLQECMCYILNNHKQSPDWEFSGSKSKKILYEDEPETYEKNTQILLHLLSKFDKYDYRYGDSIDILRQNAENSIYIDVKVHLFQVKKEYKRCFDIYFTSNETLRKRVFQWLDSVMPQIRRSSNDEFKIFKECVIYRLKDLVRLDGEETRKVIAHVDPSLEEQAIKHLEQTPDLQLKYLRNVINERENGGKVSDEMLITYIRLLCRIAKNEVLKEVKRQTYPLEECLKLCREYDIPDARAYFLEKIGNCKEALEINLQLFRDALDTQIINVEQYKKLDDTEIKERAENCIQLCIKNNKRNDVESENIWFTLLSTFLYVQENKVGAMRKFEEAVLYQAQGQIHDDIRRLVHVCSSFITSFFEEIIHYVSVETILQKLQEQNSLKLGNLKASLCKLLETYAYEYDILEDAKKFLIDDNFTDVEQIYTNVGKAVRGMKTDSSLTVGDKISIYPCGHIFPRSLVNGSYCVFCTDTDILDNQKLHGTIKRTAKKLLDTESRGYYGMNAREQDPKLLLIEDRKKLTLAVEDGIVFGSKYRDNKNVIVSRLRKYNQTRQYEIKDEFSFLPEESDDMF